VQHYLRSPAQIAILDCYVRFLSGALVSFILCRGKAQSGGKGERAMANEVENKYIAREDDRQSAASESVQKLNSVDLLKPQANSTDDARFNFKDDISQKLVGKLEITDNRLPGKLEISDSKLPGKDGFEASGEKFKPLNKTETMILNSMQDAIRSGSVEKVQDMLSTLSENPQSVNRVLQELKSRLEAENFLNHVNWEQGHDNNGNPFVRLNMYHADNASKSSGGTDLTIGSDGRNSASYRGRWDSAAKPVDLQTALGSMARSEDYRDAYPVKPEYPFPNKPEYPYPHNSYDSQYKKR
jgi:hypothetical protein